MRAPGLAMLAALSALGGCAGFGFGAPRDVQVRYAPPMQEPPQAESLVVRGDPQEILTRIQSRLRQPPFTVERADPAGGFVVARYTGDPEPYLNCGLLLTFEPGGRGAPEPVPGARAVVELPRVIRSAGYTVRRGMQLNARIVVLMIPEADGTLVTTDGDYIVTKTTETLDLGGARRGFASETIAFGSGERAAFPKETACQPNGALERLAVEGLYLDGASAGS